MPSSFEVSHILARWWFGLGTLQKLIATVRFLSLGVYNAPTFRDIQSLYKLLKWVGNSNLQGFQNLEGFETTTAPQSSDEFFEKDLGRLIVMGI